MSPYNYAAGNPVRYIDPDGLAPGDIFKSEKEASEDFFMNYNYYSFVRRLEVGTSPYKYIDALGNEFFTYAIPVVGEKSSVAPQAAKMNKEGFVRTGAEFHIQGPYDEYSLNPDDFSPQDLDRAQYIQNKSYVGGPGGLLRVYIPGKEIRKGENIIIRDDMPKELFINGISDTKSMVDKIKNNTNGPLPIKERRTNRKTGKEFYETIPDIRESNYDKDIDKATKK